MAKWIAENGIQRDVTGSQQFTDFIKSEIDKLGRIAKEADIRLE